MIAPQCDGTRDFVVLGVQNLVPAQQSSYRSDRACVRKGDQKKFQIGCHKKMFYIGKFRRGGAVETIFIIFVIFFVEPGPADFIVLL